MQIRMVLRKMNDLEANLNHYDEVSMNPSKCIVNLVAEEDEQMDVTKFTEEVGNPTREDFYPNHQKSNRDEVDATSNQTARCGRQDVLES
jgi:hypothetical protein